LKFFASIHLNLAAFLVSFSYLENGTSRSQSGANILHERGQGEMIFRYRTNQSLPFSLIQVGVVSPHGKRSIIPHYLLGFKDLQSDMK
jgi:hypothetical protein